MRSHKPLRKKKCHVHDCDGESKEISRKGSGKHLEIKFKCEKCGKESTLMPNLLSDIFSI